MHVLWEDHRNDLFINGFGMLSCSPDRPTLMVFRYPHVCWWQPIAMVVRPSGWHAGKDLLNRVFLGLTMLQIATGVIIAWLHTIYEQFGLLAGKSAPNEFIQLVIYKAMTFSTDIDKIDTVRAYHSGPVRSFPERYLRFADSAASGLFRRGRHCHGCFYPSMEGTRYFSATPRQARGAAKRRTCICPRRS